MTNTASVRATDFVTSSGSGSFLTLDAEGGLQLSSLKAGTILEVRTRNNAYTVIPQESGTALLCGHPEYCPEPIAIEGIGSSYITGVFREGYLGTGMRLTFPHQGKRVFTSRIVSIERKQRN